MKVARIIISVLLMFALLYQTFAIRDLYKQYEEDVTYADSAVQASQLSSEYILQGMGLFATMFLIGILVVWFQLTMLPSYFKRHEEEQSSVELEG